MEDTNAPTTALTGPTLGRSENVTRTDNVSIPLLPDLLSSDMSNNSVVFYVRRVHTFETWTLRLESQTDLITGQQSYYGSDEDAGTPRQDLGRPFPVKFSKFNAARDRFRGVDLLRFCEDWR